VRTKKIPVILAVAFSLAFAGFAEAAKPKKRTRNANRVGAYGAALFGSSRYKGDNAANEANLRSLIEDSQFPTQDLVLSTKSNDIGYQATFGYRFNRYVSAELGLAQFGSLTTKLKGELDAGDGFVPVTAKDEFSVGGPMFSALGILPLNDKFEVYLRAGILFASAERELSTRLDGQNAGFASAKGDSTEPVFGLGVQYHFNQLYSVRAEYQKIGEVGEENRTGTRDLNVAAIGMVIRF
jgi:hypothetical protein